MADTNTYDSFQKVEKWTTKEKFNALDLSTIETGTEYNLTGKIGANDLDSELLVGINGKLTAPTKPLEDSVVTMSAGGTTGTKPLSEIGGGGGKLYSHKICLNWSDRGYNYEIYFTIFSSIGESLTINDLYQNLKYHDYVFVDEMNMDEENFYIGDIHMDSNDAIRIDSITVFNTVNTISKKEFIIDTITATIADTYVEL